MWKYFKYVRRARVIRISKRSQTFIDFVISFLWRHSVSRRYFDDNNKRRSPRCCIWNCCGRKERRFGKRVLCRLIVHKRHRRCQCCRLTSWDPPSPCLSPRLKAFSSTRRQIRAVKLMLSGKVRWVITVLTYNLIKVLPSNKLQITFTNELVVRQKVKNEFRIEGLNVIVRL